MSKISTPDLYLAAFLQVRGSPPARTGYNGTQTIFEFDSPQLNALVTEFFANGPVGVGDYTTALRVLRGLCRKNEGSAR